MGLDQGNDTKVEQHHEQIALDLKKNRSTLKEGKIPAAIAVPIRQQMVDLKAQGKSYREIAVISHRKKWAY
jgi:hypothetical protein